MSLPAEGAHIWNTYGRLRRRKGGSGFGPSPLEWPDIQAFMASAQYPLTPWEIEVIEDIDDAYISEQIRGMTPPTPPGDKLPGKTKPMKK